MHCQVDLYGVEKSYSDCKRSGYDFLSALLKNRWKISVVSCVIGKKFNLM